MRSKLLLIILVLSSSFGFAQFQIISPEKGASVEIKSPLRTINDHGVDGVEVGYHFSQLLSFPTIEKGKEFRKLSIPDFSHLQKIGYAAMPAHIDLIVIPEGASYKLVVSDDVPIVANTNTVFPALQPATDTEGDPEPKFEINKNFYSSEQIYPEKNVQIIGFMKFRGLRMAMVQVCPVQYNPAEGKLFIHENINYSIEFTGANRFEDYTKNTENYTRQIVDYPINSSLWKKETRKYYQQHRNIMLDTSGSKNYIILTTSEFKTAADSMAAWKRKMGYSVEIVVKNNWTAATVSAAVHNRYAAWNIKPDYLLIIGDHQDVPAEIHYTPSGGEAFGTDLYYVCMDGAGDFVPDMAKGRISPSSASNAMMQVHKIINYERNPIADTSFYHNLINCAMYQDDNHDGYADRRFLQTSENIRDYLQSKSYNSQRIYYTDNSVTPSNYNNGYYSTGMALPTELLKSNGFNWTGGSTDIKNAINLGKFLVFHRDHGYSGGTGWAHPYYTSSKIAQLSNGNKLPVVFSINCHTGEFTLPSCFAETFMRKNNAGAVGVVAASYYSYSGYNDGFSIGMIDGIWSNPGLLPVFGNGGNTNPAVNAHNDIVKMGDVMNHGLVRMVQTWGGNSNGNRYSYELFHYFGDPSMRIYTQAPDSLLAIVSDTINCTDTIFYITNCTDSNAVATITSGDVLLGKTTLVNGNGSILLDSVFGSRIMLTISARNKIPYSKQLLVGNGNSLSLYSQILTNKCFGDSSASIRISPSCGTLPYHIMWNTGDTTERINHLSSGVYTVIVTDANNIAVIDTFIIAGAGSALQFNPTITNAKCYFTSTGAISLNTSGGVPPYSFVWSVGGLGDARANLSAGTYQATVTDSLGCSYSQSFTITQPSALDMNVSKTDDATNNCSGTATCVPLGGTPPYTYLWNDPASQTTATANNLCKGLYRIVLKDSNLCRSYRSLYIYNTVGINTAKGNTAEINIFPNPSENGMFTLNFKNIPSELMQLKLYNALGKLIRNSSIKTFTGKQYSVDISNFANGIYYLQLTDNSKTFVFKLFFK